MKIDVWCLFHLKQCAYIFEYEYKKIILLLLLDNDESIDEICAWCASHFGCAKYPYVGQNGGTGNQKLQGARCSE